MMNIPKQTLQHVAILKLRQSQTLFVNGLYKEGHYKFNLDHPYTVKYIECVNMKRLYH